MSVITELEKKAMGLPKRARGQLATKLIASLGTPFDDEDDDVIALALRRAKEMDEHPETIMSEDEFWESLKEFRH
jgi:hypothetical protein